MSREAHAALAAGATEFDMVLHVPDLAASEYTSVFNDILAVRKACSPASKTTQPVLKVILETSQLSEKQIIAGCVMARAAGADFVKTSTGFLGRGASVQDVQLMRATVGMSWDDLGLEGSEGLKQVKVKASGGIKTAEQVREMVSAGAERIGASASVAIFKDASSGQDSEHG